MKKIITALGWLILPALALAGSFYGNISTDFQNFTAPVVGDTIFDIAHNQVAIRFNLNTDAIMLDKLKLHLSGYYLMDNADSPVDASTLKLYSGYLKYKLDPVKINIGRMISLNKPLSGYYDGIGVSSKFGNLSCNANAGLPVTSGFEMGENRKFADDARYDVNFDYQVVKSILFGLAYTDLKEGGQVIGQVIGVSGKFNYEVINSWFTFNYAIEPENLSDIDVGINGKIATKLNYDILYQQHRISRPLPPIFVALIDYLGLEKVESDELHKMKLDRYMAGITYMFLDDWGLSLNYTGSEYNSTSDTWMDVAIMIPWGEIGYRMDSGDAGDQSGPFGNLSYAIGKKLNLFLAVHLLDWTPYNSEASSSYLFSRIGGDYSLTNSIRLNLAYEYVKPGDDDPTSRILAGINYNFWRAF
jgi:hypothetical protein